MSATTDYQQRLKAKGWVYLDDLPANTPLGSHAEHLVGGRSAWSPSGSRYELAPAAVQIEQLGRNAGFLYDQAEADFVLNTLDPAVSAIGLDKGISGVVGKALGINPTLLLLIALIIGYLMLVQVGLVPSFKKAVS